MNHLTAKKQRQNCEYKRQTRKNAQLFQDMFLYHSSILALIMVLIYFIILQFIYNGVPYLNNDQVNFKLSLFLFHQYTI